MRLSQAGQTASLGAGHAGRPITGQFQEAFPQARLPTYPAPMIALFTPSGAPLPARVVPNPRLDRASPYPAALRPILSLAAEDAARREIASWPGYAPTPLRNLPARARAIGLGNALKNLPNNLLWIFRARIVARHDDLIGPFASHLRHAWALRPIAITAASKHHTQSPTRRNRWTKRREHIRKRIIGVRVVNKHTKASATNRNRLQPTGRRRTG